MSIQSFYRVECSGWCGKYLGKYYNEYSAVHEWDDLLCEFDNWAAANKHAALAGWFDGSQGEYAQCSCEKPDNTRAWDAHAGDCRIVLPRLVPICPDCRERYY
jgi:hypothetical protein